MSLTNKKGGIRYGYDHETEVHKAVEETVSEFYKLKG